MGNNYSEDPKWEDIIPLPQDEGGPNPLAAIAYTDEYSEAMSYLRAIMAKNEMSERALELTEDIIDMNAAHYTVWYILVPCPLLLPSLDIPPLVSSSSSVHCSFLLPTCHLWLLPLPLPLPLPIQRMHHEPYKPVMLTQYAPAGSTAPKSSPQ